MRVPVEAFLWSLVESTMKTEKADDHIEPKKKKQTNERTNEQTKNKQTNKNKQHKPKQRVSNNQAVPMNA
jgi:hypothetical protein